MRYQTALRPEADEREHIRQAIAGVQQLIGSRKIGWMTGRPSPNTRRLLVESGGVLYDRDALNDELPYWVTVGGKPHLVIPYSYETNDNRCNEHRGFKTSDDFFAYLKDAFEAVEVRVGHLTYQVKRRWTCRSCQMT